MELLLVGLIFVLNFAISWWNAYVCGKVWAETKAVGGWRRFMAWVTAVMSGLGFSWCYLIVVAVVGESPTVTVPSWRATTSATIESPRPAPRLEDLARDSSSWVNRSKIRLRC